MQNGIDKRAIIAIGVLVVLVLALAGGLFLFLNRAELPDLNIAGVFEDVREGISGIFSEAEEAVIEHAEPPPVVEEQNETEDRTESVISGFSEELLFSVGQGVSTTAVRGGFLYFVAIPEESPGYIVVRQLLLGGVSAPTLLSVEWEPDRAMQVFSLAVTTEGEFRIFLTDIRRDGTDRRFFYVQYDRMGERMFQHELPADLFQSLDNLSSVVGAFTEAGELVAQGIDGCDTRIAVMDVAGVFRGEFDPGCGRIGRARDGRIVFSDSHDENLWELDLVAVSLGTQLADSGVTGSIYVTVSPQQGLFDLYFTRNVDDVRYLYGYMIATGDWTRLFAWEDVGTAENRTLFLVAALSDGSMVIRERFDDTVQTDFILLVPEIYDERDYFEI